MAFKDHDEGGGGVPGGVCKTAVDRRWVGQDEMKMVWYGLLWREFALFKTTYGNILTDNWFVRIMISHFLALITAGPSNDTFISLHKKG